MIRPARIIPRVGTATGVPGFQPRGGRPRQSLGIYNVPWRRLVKVGVGFELEYQKDDVDDE
jgi:hypothetical protein